MPRRGASRRCARCSSNKYYFDWFNENVRRARSRAASASGCGRAATRSLIDGALVNGTAATVGWFGGLVRRVQSGYLYSYAFWMIIGLALLLGWFLRARLRQRSHMHALAFCRS